MKPLSKKGVFFISIFLVVLTTVLAMAILTITRNNVMGGDLIVFYNASQSSFIEGKGPYLEENNIKSQLALGGRLSKAGEDFLTFSYPPYSLLPFLPMVSLSFDWFQAIWLAVHIILITVTIQFFYANAPLWSKLTIFFFYPFSFGLILGNFAISLTVLILILYSSLFILSENKPISIIWQVILGMILAWSTIKPQFTWLFIIFFILTAWKKHYLPLLISFGASLVVFLAISFVILPTWIPDWFHQITFYAQTNETTLYPAIFLQTFLPGEIAKYGTIIILGLILVITGWIFKAHLQNKISALLTLSWIGLATYLMHPSGVAYEQLTFLIPFFIWVFQSDRKPNLWVRGIFWFTGIAISWIGFFAGRFYNGGFLAGELIFGFYILWMAWYTWQQRSYKPTGTSLITDS